ncbi:uncharacterized protein LOC125500229 [Athalia rosae]|uniref:uncharacterized protein LOC125500229 n=1 Tax=Athalia rosae TaxID=37344 RepID=UPI0020346B9B|nr:uncharacterized protein LOC125500229 [Athalia rosae]
MPLPRSDEESERDRRANQRAVEQLSRDLEAAHVEIETLRQLQQRSSPNRLTETLRAELEEARAEIAELKRQRDITSEPAPDEQLRREVEEVRRQLATFGVGRATAANDMASEGPGGRGTGRREPGAIQFRDVEGTIPKFSGDDRAFPVEKWIGLLEENSRLFNWTPLQTLVFAKKALEGTARLWLDGQTTFAAWHEMKRELMDEFKTKTDSKEIHEMLANRKKKDDETYQEYILQMRRLANRVELDQAVVIQYIVDGIRDYESNKVILYGATNFTELRERMRHYEAIRGKLSVNKQSTKKAFGKSPGGSETSCSVKSTPAQSTLCYNCGMRGHLSKDCRHQEKGPKCFRCRKFGHIAPACPQIVASPTDTQERNPPATLHIGAAGLDACIKKVEINGVGVECLLDSGSTYNILREDLRDELGLHGLDSVEEELTAASGGKIRTKGRLKVMTVIDGVCYPLTYRVVSGDTIPTKALLGADLLNHAVVQLSKHDAKVWPALIGGIRSKNSSTNTNRREKKRYRYRYQLY